MNILVIGSGGREHALSWALGRSPSTEKVYVSPGNPGTCGGGHSEGASHGEGDAMAACLADLENVHLDPMDFASIADFARERRVDLVVVGPENPLAAGIADFLRGCGVSVFGPGKDGAKLESSKSAAKEFMARHKIPHPAFASFDDPRDAADYVRSHPGPWVLKADGLALGKGVSILTEEDAAIRTIHDYMVSKTLGQAGSRLVIEEYLEGYEVSAMALCDGRRVLALPLAKDHKRLFDGDLGPMTGGMGAYSPVPFVDDGTARAIREQILERTLAGLQAEGIDYRGVIYAGLMVTRSGPKVLEYNVRFGDPETQCLLPRLEGDLAETLLSCAEGRLGSHDPVSVNPNACVTVVLASGGYPGSYRKGFTISGLDTLDSGTLVFHAGTAEVDGKLVTAGGRVLAVTCLGPNSRLAEEAVYREVRRIHFDGVFYRSDVRVPDGGAVRN